MRILLDRPWLAAQFEAPKRVLSWAPHRPGFVETTCVLWREVRDADLTPELDALAWFRQDLASRDALGAVGLLTSRNVARHIFGSQHFDGGTVQVLATVGLSNAERVGHRQRAVPSVAGTINLLVNLDLGLTDAAFLETMSIATQARTAAVMELGPDLPTGRVTGTGTDCIVVAAPAGDTGFAGLHTALGEAVGRVVYDTIAEGTRVWMKETHDD